MHYPIVRRKTRIVWALIGFLILISGLLCISYAIHDTIDLHYKYEIIDSYESLYRIDIYAEGATVAFGRLQTSPDTTTFSLFFEGVNETQTHYLFDLSIISGGNSKYIQNFSVLLNNSKIMDITSDGVPLVYNYTIKWPKNTYIEFKIVHSLCMTPPIELRNSTIMYLAHKQLMEYLSTEQINKTDLENAGIYIIIKFVFGLTLFSIGAVLIFDMPVLQNTVSDQ